MIALKVPEEVIRKDDEFKFKRIENQLKQLPEDCWRTDAIPCNTLAGIKLNSGMIVILKFGVDMRIEEVGEFPHSGAGWFPIE